MPSFEDCHNLFYLLLKIKKKIQWQAIYQVANYCLKVDREINTIVALEHLAS